LGQVTIKRREKSWEKVYKPSGTPSGFFTEHVEEKKKREIRFDTCFEVFRSRAAQDEVLAASEDAGTVEAEDFEGRPRPDFREAVEVVFLGEVVLALRAFVEVVETLCRLAAGALLRLEAVVVRFLPPVDVVPEAGRLRVPEVTLAGPEATVDLVDLVDVLVVRLAGAFLVEAAFLTGAFLTGEAARVAFLTGDLGLEEAVAPTLACLLRVWSSFFPVSASL